MPKARHESHSSSVRTMQQIYLRGRWEGEGRSASLLLLLVVRIYHLEQVSPGWFPLFSSQLRDVHHCRHFCTSSPSLFFQSSIVVDYFTKFLRNSTFLLKISLTGYFNSVTALIYDHSLYSDETWLSMYIQLTWRSLRSKVMTLLREADIKIPGWTTEQAVWFLLVCALLLCEYGERGVTKNPHSRNYRWV